MINTLIVDDEASAIRTMETMLRNYCPKVNIIGKTTSPVDAIEIIKEQKPDLVLLDIDMPEMDGFKMLESISIKNFEVVFITASNQLAIKAFKVSAVDYILKPISIPELIQAIDKVDEIVNSKQFTSEKYKVLLDNLKPAIHERIALPSSEGSVLVLPDEIICIESYKNYSSFYLTNGRKILVSKTIGDIDLMLKQDCFIRIHKMGIVNIKHIVKYNTHKSGGDVVLVNSKLIPISRRKKKEFITKFEKYILKI